MKKLILLFTILVSLSSCMVIGTAIGGKKTTSEKEYILNSKESISESKLDLKQVLYDDGWNKLSENKTTITFTKTSTILGQLVFAKTKNFTIISTFNKKRVNLEIVQHGNFKVGTNKKVEETFLAIKNKYEKIK